MQNFKYKRLYFACSSLCLFTNAISSTKEDPPPFYITGTIITVIQTKEVLPSKEIALFKVTPSDLFMSEKNKLTLKEELDYTKGIISFSKSPGAIDLGMNNTPVFDQGKSNTCVTFAVTAALDAILGLGDFISQQCSLQLNLALGNNNWGGAYYPSEIIDPLKKYGLVQQGQCNAAYPNPDVLINLTEYKERASKTINLDNISYKYFNMVTLDIVKAALNAKHRILTSIGVNITSEQISVQGFNMTLDGESTAGGLWACKQPSSNSNYCGVPNAGHEFVIMGYDDNQELLKIRNSWSKDVGDNGDFYMTYRFFKSMSGNGTEIY